MNWKRLLFIIGIICVLVVSYYILSLKPCREVKVVLLTEGFISRGPSYHCSGKIIFHSSIDRDNQLWSMYPDGSNQTPITTVGVYEEDYCIGDDRIFFLGKDRNLWEVNIKKGKERCLGLKGRGEKKEGKGIWAHKKYFFKYISKTNELFFIRINGDLYSLNMEKNTISFIGKFVDKNKRIIKGGDISSDGDKIAFEKDGYIYLMDRYTKITELLAKGELPRWTQAKNKILFFYSGKDKAEMYIMDVISKDKKTLYSGKPYSISGYDSLDISPDGTKLAYIIYSMNKDGIPRRSDICVMNMDGTKRINVTKKMGAKGYFSPSWLPNGKKIVFCAGDGYWNNICVMELE